MNMKKPIAKKTFQAPRTTSWGSVSTWYNELVENDDSYQTKVIAPNLMRIMGEVKGKHVLDLACGQGYFSRLLDAQGAIVDALDISPELVEHAKRKGGTHITYHVGPAHKLPFLKNGSTDIVISVLAFQNIENLPEVMAEIARVLSKDGTVYLVLNHPAFRIPQGSDWGFDEGKNVQYRKEEYYLSEKKIVIDMHPGKKGSPKTVSFHHPLQYFFKLFGKYNFAVTRLEEWNSHKKSQPGPREKAEDRARKEFPLFMAVQLRLLK